MKLFSILVNLVTSTVYEWDFYAYEYIIIMLITFKGACPGTAASRNCSQIGIILMPKSINESPVKYLQNIPLVYSKYTFQDLPSLSISASEIIRHFHNSTLSVSVKTENIAEKMSTN